MDKELLYRFFRCEATPQEEDRVMDWIDASVENSRRFEQERTRYYKLYLNAPGVIEARKTSLKRKSAISKTLIKYTAGAAAVFALIIASALLMKSNVIKEFESITTEIIVPNGQRMQLKLSDGTLVSLNSGTILEYPVVFGKERRVRLKGEGLFEVEHNPKSPFIVETFACDLEVLGTRFNVLADETEQEFSASLFQGSLKLCNFLYGNVEYIMEPSESISLNGQALVLNHMTGDSEMLWTQGLVSLENISFEKLMKKFEKCYDVQIVLECETVPALKLSRGKIKVSEGIDHALRILQTSADFTYTKENENRLIIIK